MILYKLWRKIRKWINKKLFKNQITVKGIYFYKYLKKYLTNEWTESDYIEDYENAIEEFRADNNISKRDAIIYYFSYLNAVLEESEEKYGEEPLDVVYYYDVAG